MADMPFEISRALPDITLEPLDLVLASYFTLDRGMTIVQVGACDGITNDPVRRIATRTSTRAILIEPNPAAFDRLQRAYAGLTNVQCIQAAIGERDGEAYLYRVRNSPAAEAGTDLTLQISSFYREHLEKHGKKPQDIERITVSCRTLPTLVAELGLGQIDLLQIDTEGFDAVVVRMAVEMSVRPNCINFEHIHLKEPDRRPLFRLLKERDYLLCYDEWNILAMQRSFLNIPQRDDAYVSQ